MNYNDLIERARKNVIEGWRPTVKLGEGASGVVLKGEPEGKAEGRVPVAIKLYSKDIATGHDARNIEERIRRQNMLRDHKCPYLVPLHTAGFFDPLESYYVIMGWIPYQQYAYDRIIPVDRVAPILAQVARAAKYLEECGFAHRDIKPANVLLSPDNRKAILVDLGVIGPYIDLEGVARTIQYKSDPQFLGTLRYAAPEFMRGQVKDGQEAWRAVTFYQLGALLYEMLSQKEIFAGINQFVQLTDAVKEGISFEDNTLRGPDALKKLCRACLRTDPQQRLKEVEGWEAFECMRLRKRPSVILLYAGGTIGSKLGSEGTHLREARRIPTRSDSLLESISKRLQRESALFLPGAKDQAFDLKWEVIQPEHQHFSENFTPVEWDLLARTLRDIFYKYSELPARFDSSNVPMELDQGTISSLRSVMETLGNPLQKGRFETDKEIEKIIVDANERRQLITALLAEAQECYLAGVIVLHGTDTLAYTASALAFSLRYLPCSILLTGSNQPPAEKDGAGPTQRASDAWRNLMLCLHFLRSFGHRLAETLVCFGDTIHHVVNLRKTTVSDLPLSSRGDLVSPKEPFVFRNEALPQQYMFKNIEGLYCNNFYTEHFKLERERFNNLGNEDEEFNHLRPSPFRRIKPVELLKIRECVSMFTLSPASFSSFVDPDSITFDSALRAVLIVGYDSGTIATRPGHSFMKILELLERRAIPTILVSRYGIVPFQEPYETITKFNPLRLIGVIPETALSLLTVVASQITEEEWNAGKTMQARTELLKRSIRDYQRLHRNILTLLLGDVLDEKAQQDRIIDYVQEDSRDYEARFQSALAPAKELLAGARPRKYSATTASLPFKALSSNFPESVTLPRGVFLLRELEYLRPYECAGSAPDELAIVTSVAFKVGLEVGEGPDIHFQTGETPEAIASQKIAQLQITQFFIDVCFALTERGIADIEHVSAGLSCEPDGDWTLTASFKARRHDGTVRKDELLSAHGFDNKERKLLDRLKYGAPLDETEEEHKKALEGLLRNLHNDMWQQRVSALDWSLFGFFKGAVSGLLLKMKADPWTNQCASKPEIFSRSVDLQIDAANRQEIDFICTYTSRSTRKEG